MYRLLSILLTLLCPVLYAQMPNTDLWLFKLESDKLQQITLKDPLNITNREGYDNQPAFSPDGKRLYYVSVKEDKQADIYYYDMASKMNIPFTKTRVSEYSPTPVTEGRAIASVVVEADSAQRIHFINTASGLDEKKLEMDSIGYFSFLNQDTLVYYKLTEPHSLRYSVTGTKEDKWLGDSPTRTFRMVNRHALIYGLKDSVQVQYYLYDFLLGKAQNYAQYKGAGEDILWQAPWGLIRAEENRLMRYDEALQQWVLLFDLSSFPVKKITRFAFDPKNKYLVVVNNL